MSHTQSDRIAFNENEMETIANKMIAEWLNQFPQIGTLNNGTYYYHNKDGKYTEIEAFAII